MTHRSRRSPLRVLVVSALVTGVLVGGPTGAAPRPEQPQTVLESVALDVGELAGTARDGLVARDGKLEAHRRSTTPSTVVCAPIWFTAVGVTWEQHAGTPLEVRIATAPDRRGFERSWHLDAESGADPGTREYRKGEAASTLLWTGGARCAKVRLELSGGAEISDLQMRFVNASGSSEGPGTGPPDVDPSVVSATDPGAFAPATADAIAAKPRIISRSQWGARPGLMNCTPDVADEVRAGFVHHTAGTNRYARSRADDIVRSIYAYHTNGRGWCDIAYNFLIDKYGRVYEGRSGGITEPVIGAAQQGFNTRAFSVSLMGTFSRHRPSSSMLRALRTTLAWRLDVAHLRPGGRAELTSAGGDNTRYDAGEDVRVPVITVHRRTGYTDCPGGKVVRRIRDVRRAVAKTGLPKFYGPRVEPAVVKEGSSPLRIRASGSGALTWTVSVHDGSGAELFAFPEEAGADLDLTWRGSDATPYPRVAGTYELVIRARNGSGEIARSASLSFKVKPSAV